MVRYDETWPVPRPLTNQDNEGFWAEVNAGRLSFQRCRGCGATHHPPRPMCDRCYSTDMEYAESSGRGEVYSWVRYHRAAHPGFVVPYEVVLVEMDEGVRVVSNLAEGEEAPYVGMPVEVVIEDTFPETKMPKFRQVRDGPPTELVADSARTRVESATRTEDEGGEEA